MRRVQGRRKTILGMQVYLHICIPAEQGESGHISDINILLSLISLIDIPTLRCMSRIFGNEADNQTSMCIRTQRGDAKSGFSAFA